MTNSLARQGEDTSSPTIPGCVRPSRVDAVSGDLFIDSEATRDSEISPDGESGLSNFVISTTKSTTLVPGHDGVLDEGTNQAPSLIYTSLLSASMESDSADCIFAEDCGSGKRTMPGQVPVHDTEKRKRAMEVIVDSSNGATPVCCLSTANATPCASHEENRVACPVTSIRTGNTLLVDTCGSRLSSARILSDLIDENIEDIARNNVPVSHCQRDLCSNVFSNANEIAGGEGSMVSIASCPIAPLPVARLLPDLPAACERGDLLVKEAIPIVVLTLQVAPERIEIMTEGSGASSSHASIMHSDDDNVKESQKVSCEVLSWDLETGLPIDITSSVDEKEIHGVDFAEDHKCPSLVEAKKEGVSLEAFDHDAPSCDVKDLVDSELREPLLAHVQTDDTKSSQDKELLLGGEKKLGGDSLEKEAEVHGLRKRRGTKADAIKLSAGGDSGLGKMPEEHKKGVTTTRTKDPSTEAGQEAKQKPVDKKTGKEGKGAGKPSVIRKSGDPQPLEESQLRAKEEAETNRKVHESIDSFIRQTIRCEPYMNFASRPGDKPLQRLRPDVFENHVAGKFARGLKVDNGSDPRDITAEENRGVDSNSSDVDGSKDGSTVSAKGSGGVGRGAQHSLKVPPGVVAFTQATGKSADLQGWLSPSKTKCEKCSREFCSSLNYRRHVRVHRRSLNPEKEDLSKERSKVAAFWDKLTPEEASSIVHYEKMEIVDLTGGQAALDALKVFINQLGLASLPPGILKAGLSLLDIVQNKSAVSLSSERLLAILDDASEKTFLCGGTSNSVQKFFFPGEAGKLGLEEKNLVATMGFHVELRLVKAWMADKEAEALRCQQEMIKEEEAAQQKRKKLLEKKKLKKTRQKERKGTSQLILQELDNESIDDDGIILVIGEEDDSPTGTPSSSSSLAFARDLALPELRELEETNALAYTDTDELVLGEKSDTGKNLSSDEDQLHRVRDGLSQYGREGPQLGSRRGEIKSSHRKEDPSARESIVEVGAIYHPRAADQGDWDSDFNSRSAHPSSQSRSGRTGELQSSLSYRKGEQERIGSDFKRREYENMQERRPVRITRDRSRNDYEQKSLRDPRTFDARYGDGHLTTFKQLRKPNPYFGKGDSGNVDLSNTSRSQQYRSKPPGMTRASSNAGIGQAIWTKKVPQPAAVEATKGRQEEIVRDDAESSKVDGWAASEALSEAALGEPYSAGEDFATKLDKEGIEKEDDAATPVPLDVSLANDMRLAGPSVDVISAQDTPEVDEGLSDALLVGSLTVPLGKFAVVSTSQPRLGSNAAYLRHPDDTEIGNVSRAGSYDGSYGLPGVVLSGKEAASLAHIHIAPGSSDGSEPLDNSLGSPFRASGSRSNASSTQPAKLKLYHSSCSPERGEFSRQNCASLGQEKLGVKQGSWVPSSGRYIPAKVWRPVGMVGERQDVSAPGVHAGIGDNALSLVDARMSQDVSFPGRIDGDIVVHQEAVRQSSLIKEDEFLREDCQEGLDLNDGSPVEMNVETCKTSDKEAKLSSSSVPFKPARLESGLLSEGEAQIDNGLESSIMASGLCTLSDYVEVAGVFLSERWRVALASASNDEVLKISNDSVTKEANGLNFLDVLFRQMSKENSRHSPSAESGLSPSSSVVTELSGRPAQDVGVQFSRIFSDSDQTGVGDIRCGSTIDEQGLDGSSPQSPSEDDSGLMDTSTSPVPSEHYMSGNEMVSSAPVASGGNYSESGGGGVGSSYARRGNSRQERWHRNSRERFHEQRYTARRRAPVEKQSRV